jgi:hypothetical protein
MKHELAAVVQQAPHGFGHSALREYLQARMLQQIALSGSMTSIAFHGGTALRFLYALPRFSEDLDFALEHGDGAFSFDGMLEKIARGFEREGYAVEAKLMRERTAVRKAYLKFPGLLHEMGLSPHASEVISIKVEVDTNPPAGAVCEISEVRRHVLARVYHHDRASLYAGKLAAVLMRQYTKGRDLYDLMWYSANPAWPQPNFTLLNNSIAQNDWSGPVISETNWRELVLERLSRVEWAKARTEVEQFLERVEEADLLEYDTFERILTRGGA